MKLLLHHILNMLFTSPDCMAADIINTAFPSLKKWPVKGILRAGWLLD